MSSLPNVGIIDCMLDPVIPPPNSDWSKQFAVKDEQSVTGELWHPAGYMYKQEEALKAGSKSVEQTLRKMDQFGIEMAVMLLSSDEAGRVALRYPERFLPYVMVDPNDGMNAVRTITAMYEKFGIVAASFFPVGAIPQVPLNDKRAYPIYAKCVELDIACFVTAGVPGPRLPFEPQYVGHADEVCYFFPELRLVLQHGCNPWQDLAVALMLKWPGLYFMTSAFAPRYYSKVIIDFANTRGSDKILYAGYYPHGLTLERIFQELPEVPFRDHVWPKFLRENALAVLKPGSRKLAAAP